MLHLCVCSANLTTINKAILYVKNNEQTHNVCIIHATDREEHLPPKLRENVRLLDSIYPKLRMSALFSGRGANDDKSVGREVAFSSMCRCVTGYFGPSVQK